MEKLYERLQSANQNLKSLQEIVEIENPSSIERDAGIQRFKYCFEASRKAGKQYLYDIQGIDIGSPKGVMRSFREVGVFFENETILSLQMVNDRNLTVHTYNEELAIEIFGNIPKYYKLLKDWIERLNSKLK